MYTYISTVDMKGNVYVRYIVLSFFFDREYPPPATSKHSGFLHY